jgi:hypothetical protein
MLLKIDILNEIVVIEIYPEGKSLPHLNFGEIGNDYNIVPIAVKIEELMTFSHVLVVGNMRSNCEEWRNKLTLTPIVR